MIEKFFPKNGPYLTDEAKLDWQNLIGKHCGFIDGTVIPLNPALSACGKAIGSAIFVNVHFNGTTHHYNAKRFSIMKICLGNS